MYVNRFFKPITQRPFLDDAFVLPSDQRAQAPPAQVPLQPAESTQSWQWLAGQGTQPLPKARWHSSRFPLKIFIASAPTRVSSSVEAQAPLSPAQVWQWLRPWADMSGEWLTLVMHPFESTADIAIQWTGDTTLGRPYEVGHCQNRLSDQGLIEHADITLVIAPVIDATLLPPQQRQRLQATVLHEFGHALGLEHGQHPSDVMFHQGWRNTRLSRQDLEQLQRLYAKAGFNCLG
jgi:predicted Zn-dependent protease